MVSEHFGLRKASNQGKTDLNLSDLVKQARMRPDSRGVRNVRRAFQNLKGKLYK